MEISNFQIRDCCRGDLEKVDELERICFPDSPVLPMVALVQYFDLFKKTFVIAEYQSSIVGFAIGGSCSIDSKAAWILDVAVLTDYRKCGIASAMLTELISRFRKNGTTTIRVTVSPKNVSSRRMLEKCGFQTIEEIDEYFGKGEPRLLLQEMKLG